MASFLCRSLGSFPLGNLNKIVIVNAICSLLLLLLLFGYCSCYRYGFHCCLLKAVHKTIDKNKGCCLFDVVDDVIVVVCGRRQRRTAVEWQGHVFKQQQTRNNNNRNNNNNNNNNSVLLLSLPVSLLFLLSSLLSFRRFLHKSDASRRLSAIRNCRVFKASKADPAKPQQE